MELYKLDASLDANKVFLVKRSELFGRFDPSVYCNNFQFISEIFENKKLSDIALINPTTNLSSLPNEEEISFIQMDAVDEHLGNLKYIETKKVAEKVGFTRFKENDLIWAKITPCMQNGKSAVVRDTINGFALGSTEFFIIRPKNENIKVEYLHFLLRDKRVLETAMKYFGGSAGQQRVSKDFLLNFNVPVPPTEIQENIVSIIQNAYTQKQAKETEAKALLASIDTYLLNELGITLPEKDNSLEARIFTTKFSEVVGRRFDGEFYTEYNRSLLKSINNSFYQLDKIRNNCEFISGYAFSSETYVENSDCILITIKNISENNIDLKNVTYLPNEYYEYYKRFIINKNDLLIAMTGATIGKVGIYEKDVKALLNQRNGIIKSNKMNTYFLMNLLNTNLYQKLILRNAVGGAQPNISETDIMKVQIPIPPLEKQNEIAEHIAEIRYKAKALLQEAEQVLATAKQQVEQMILG